VGPTLVVGEPKPLFDTAPYTTIGVSFDAAPDGRLLMKRPVGAATARPDQIILVENFFAELRSKMNSR
jgi:hypothetical protein